MSRSSRTRRSDTRDPRRSRARALKLLYQADVRGEDPVELLERIVTDPRAAALLDDLDPEEAAEIGSALPADHPDADMEHGRIAAARARNVAPIDGFTRSLVVGVADRRDELDTLVQGFARRWAVSRMPAVDRNALRLGAYELQHETTSPAVVINEIVELAKGLSTDDSGRYVNGVLESIRKRVAADRDADAAGTDTEDVVDLAPPVPDPVALPDDVELIEAATPEQAPPPEDVDEPAPLAAVPDLPDEVDLQLAADDDLPADDDEAALAEVAEAPVTADDLDTPEDTAGDTSDDVPDDALAADEPTTDGEAERAAEEPATPDDELRHEHAHLAHEDRSGEDSAQQQLF